MKTKGSGKVVPKSYQREGQPRKTENEITNGSKPKPNPNPNPNPNATLTLKKKKLRKET